MSSWGSWSSCSPTNGKCGAGTQYQTRRVTTQPYCSSPCPANRQTRSCTHSCCPVDCVTSSWTAWSSCSTTCGTGTWCISSVWEHNYRSVENRLHLFSLTLRKRLTDPRRYFLFQSSCHADSKVIFKSESRLMQTPLNINEFHLLTDWFWNQNISWSLHWKSMKIPFFDVTNEAKATMGASLLQMG